MKKRPDRWSREASALGTRLLTIGFEFAFHWLKSFNPIRKTSKCSNLNGVITFVSRLEILLLFWVNCKGKKVLIYGKKELQYCYFFLFQAFSLPTSHSNPKCFSEVNIADDMSVLLKATAVVVQGKIRDSVIMNTTYLQFFLFKVADGLLQCLNRTEEI